MLSNARSDPKLIAYLGSFEFYETEPNQVGEKHIKYSLNYVLNFELYNTISVCYPNILH